MEDHHIDYIEVTRVAEEESGDSSAINIATAETKLFKQGNA